MESPNFQNERTYTERATKNVYLEIRVVEHLALVCKMKKEMKDMKSKAKLDEDWISSLIVEHHDLCENYKQFVKQLKERSQKVKELVYRHSLSYLIVTTLK